MAGQLRGIGALSFRRHRRDGFPGEKNSLAERDGLRTVSPAVDGLVLTRYTEPEPELSRLLKKLKLELPAQPPPKITAAPAAPISL